MKRMIDNGVDFILAMMLLAMTFVVFAQVFFRYVLNAPLAWPEETARILVVWITFLGGYMALREGKHIGFNLLVKQMKRNTAYLVELFVFAAVFFFLSVVIYQGTFFAYRSLRIQMPYTGISVGWVVYSVFPVSGVLMFVQTVLDLQRAVKRHKAGA